MRKDLNRVKEQTFFDALTMLGYTTLRRDRSEWRHQQFHLFIRKKGRDGIALRMHEDVSSLMPPFHRAMHESKALEQELAKIEEACKRGRATQKPALQNTE